MFDYLPCSPRVESSVEVVVEVRLCKKMRVKWGVRVPRYVATLDPFCTRSKGFYYSELNLFTCQNSDIHFHILHQCRVQGSAFTRTIFAIAFPKSSSYHSLRDSHLSMYGVEISSLFTSHVGLSI